MEKKLSILICIVFIASKISAQTSNSSQKPTLSETKVEAPNAKILSEGTGAASYRTDVDGLGYVKNITIIRSTGSKALDDHVIKFTEWLLRGPNNQSRTFPWSYKKIELLTAHGKIMVRVITPRPPYPFEARARSQQGSGLVQVTFDRNGKVTNSVMIKTTGSEVLDRNSTASASALWKSSGGAEVIMTVPVIYRLQ